MDSNHIVCLYYHVYMCNMHLGCFISYIYIIIISIIIIMIMMIIIIICIYL
jgi:hypothetical protein